MLGSIRTQLFFVELTKGMMAENEVMEMAGAGVSDVQDDFKSSKYKGVLRYSEDNIIKDLFGKRESVSKTEGEMLIQGYLKKINEDIIFLKPKKDIRHNGFLKNVYKIHSESKERIYYYAFNNIYHNSYFCSHLPSNKEEIKVYSSMEEGALSGNFPCKKCVLGYEK